MKEYRTILIDSPWPEHGGGKCKRGADRHYPLLSVEDIPRVIVSCPLYNPAKNAHLYLWATDTYLREAFWVIKILRFRYIRTLPWIKLKDEAFSRQPSRRKQDTKLGYPARYPPVADMLKKNLKIGLGQYFRGCSELLLFSVCGTGVDPEVCTDRRDINNIIIGPRSEHSKKPESAYEKIEARSKGPFLEIFARSRRPGWDSWGNKVTDGVAR